MSSEIERQVKVQIKNETKNTKKTKIKDKKTKMKIKKMKILKFIKILSVPLQADSFPFCRDA